MEVTLLNRNFIKILSIDLPMSFIWADRYNKCGDFELFFSTQSSIYESINKKYYLSFPLSEHLMIIENLLITTNVKTGSTVKASGRSLESILDRRVIWGQLDIEGTPQDIIHELLDSTIINPTDTDRKISNFIFEESTDPIITGLGSIPLQLMGDNLYEIILSICKAYSLGFKVYLNESRQLVFKLYVGKDRSYNQTANAYVVFSSAFDNLISSEYFTSDANEKNVNLVAGEGEGSARKLVQFGSASGIDRKEMFTDAKGVSSQVDGITLTDSEYTSRLLEHGKTEVSKYKEEEMFSGEADTSRTYVYGKDFFMGDYVQTEDSYHHNGRSMVNEFIFSASKTGIKVYPTFESV